MTSHMLLRLEMADGQLQGICLLGTISRNAGYWTDLQSFWLYSFNTIYL